MKPTRGQNILDLILTTEPTMIDDIEIRDQLGTSDHNTILFELVGEVELKNTSKQIRVWLVYCFIL